MGERFVTSLRVDKETWKEAKKLAIERDTTVGELVEGLLKREIK